MQCDRPHPRADRPRMQRLPSRHQPLSLGFVCMHMHKALSDGYIVLERLLKSCFSMIQIQAQETQAAPRGKGETY